MDHLAFNKSVIEEFRANEGVCGGPFASQRFTAHRLSTVPLADARIADRFAGTLMW